MKTFSRSARLGAAFALAIAGVVGVRHLAFASDHQDTADVELNPSQDMTDFYAFPGATSDRIALVLNSWPVITPAQAATVSFDPNLLYQIKVDNTGDAVEDKVIQITFTGTGAAQQVQVRGPMTPPVLGAMNNTVSPSDPVVTGPINSVLGTAGGIQVYAGVRDDPFFIDLEQFFRILPDRKPVTGTLAALPSTQSATAFRPVGQAVDFLAGFNVLSIVIEMPTATLTAGGTAKLGLWGTISR
jgi:hypothetical protein